jgi:uncharacterized protein YdhG (YjbR/CyaY superfamily)
MPSTASRVDEYLAELKPPRRRELALLRLVIRRAAPAASEGIRHGIPAYHVGRPICAFAAQKKCLAFYLLDPNVVNKFRPRLKNLSVSKGCIRFRTLKELPVDVICHMLAEASERCVNGDS